MWKWNFPYFHKGGFHIYKFYLVVKSFNFVNIALCKTKQCSTSPANVKTWPRFKVEITSILDLWFPNGGNFVPRRRGVISEGILNDHNLELGAVYNWQVRVEARDASEHPAMHTTVLQNKDLSTPKRQQCWGLQTLLYGELCHLQCVWSWPNDFS